MSEDGIYDGTRFETDADELCPFYNRLGRINGTKGRGRCEEERDHGVSENRKWTKNRMRGRQGARRFGEADWRNVENCATPTLGSRNRKKIHWPTSVADPGSNTDAGDPSIKKMLPSKNLKKKKNWCTHTFNGFISGDSECSDFFWFFVSHSVLFDVLP